MRPRHPPRRLASITSEAAATGAAASPGPPAALTGTAGPSDRLLASRMSDSGGITQSCAPVTSRARLHSIKRTRRAVRTASGSAHRLPRRPSGRRSSRCAPYVTLRYPTSADRLFARGRPSIGFRAAGGSPRLTRKPRAGGITHDRRRRHGAWLSPRHPLGRRGPAWSRPAGRTPARRSGQDPHERSSAVTSGEPAEHGRTARAPQGAGRPPASPAQRRRGEPAARSVRQLEAVSTDRAASARARPPGAAGGSTSQQPVSRTTSRASDSVAVMDETATTERRGGAAESSALSLR